MFSKEGDIVGQDLPYKYLGDYTNSLFTEEYRDKIYDFATVHINDAWFTLIPLIYGGKEVALAWILMASRILEIEINGITKEKWKRMREKYFKLFFLLMV